MPSLAGFSRPTKHLAASDPKVTLVHMREMARLGIDDARVRLLGEKIVRGVFPHDYLSEFAAFLNWVRTHIRYSRDPVDIEQLKTPQVTLETETGDCMTLDTKIVVMDEAGFYQLRTLGELRQTYRDYRALSYNFAGQRFEFQPITAWMDKGEQEVFEVRLHNGYSAFCTSGHKFFVWQRKTASYEVQLLSQLWRGDHMVQGASLLLAKQIPILNRDDFWQDWNFDPAATWLAGSYLSEGWCETSKVGIAKQDPTERREITRRLEALGVPYSESKRLKSAYVSVLKHPFKEFLKLFGHRAYAKRIPFEALSSSRELIEELLCGYAWGDSWQPPGDVPRKSHQNHVAMHSTISDELAEQIKFIYLLLGRPLSGNLVHRHGGLGKHPIWRLWEAADKPHPLTLATSTRPTGLCSKGIRFVESVGVQPVCDITVAGNHNFVLLNGLLAHNCDDLSILLAAFCAQFGAKVRFVAGAFRSDYNGPIFSHVWCEAFDPMTKAWVILDPVPGRRVAQMVDKLVDSMVLVVAE